MWIREQTKEEKILITVRTISIIGQDIDNQWTRRYYKVVTKAREKIWQTIQTMEEDIRKVIGSQWLQIAKHRHNWKQMKEANMSSG